VTLTVEPPSAVFALDERCSVVGASSFTAGASPGGGRSSTQPSRTFRFVVPPDGGPWTLVYRPRYRELHVRLE
jgi:hypothetical protein